MCDEFTTETITADQLSIGDVLTDYDTRVLSIEVNSDNEFPVTVVCARGERRLFDFDDVVEVYA